MSDDAVGVTYRSQRVELAAAPEAVQKLLRYWETRRQGDGYPAKSAIVPWELPEHLGRICLIEVERDPLSFVYRLDGSNISSSSCEDLKDRNLLAGTPTQLYRHIFEDLKQSLEAGGPVLWRVAYAHDELSFEYLRLVLPLTRQRPGDYLLTYSHSLRSDDGIFPVTRR